MNMKEACILFERKKGTAYAAPIISYGAGKRNRTAL